MQDTDNSNELQNILNQVTVGQMVYIVTTEGSMIAGNVLAIIEYMDKEQVVQKCYRIRLSDDHSIDIPRNLIYYIKIHPDYSFKDYLEEFEEKHEIACFDENDFVRPVSTIISELLGKDIWDKLEDKEKEKLIESLSIENDTIIDLVDALSADRKENKRLHNEVCKLTDTRTKALKEAVDFTKKYNEISDMIPQYKWAFEVIFEWLGLGKVLEAI